MAIPDLTETGLLPDGLHDCTLEEAQARFGRAAIGSARPALAERLGEYLADLARSAIAAWVVIDGSFVTARPDPGDIDLLVALRAGHDFAARLRPLDYNVVSRRRVSRRLGFDLLVAAEGTEALEEYLAFFQEVKGRPGERKGVLRIRL